MLTALIDACAPGCIFLQSAKMLRQASMGRNVGVEGQMGWCDSIAKVLVADKGADRGWGTAFLAAPNKLLTALHVVADLSNGAVRSYDTIVIRFEFPESRRVPAHESKAKIAWWNIDHDWALLECEVPPELECIPLVRAVAADAKWQTGGYPVANDGNWFALTGEVVSVNGQIPPNQTPAIQLYSDLVAAGQGLQAQGFSGAPVIVKRDDYGALSRKVPVAIGIVRWAPVETLQDDDRQSPRVQAGAIFATFMSDVLDGIPCKLTNYDSWTSKAIRAPQSCAVSAGHLVWDVLRLRVPFWIVLPFLPVVLPLIIWHWPEEWVPRTTYATDTQVYPTRFAPEAFLKPAYNELDQFKQEEKMLNAWKVWTRDARKLKELEQYLVVECDPFQDAAYKSFERTITAYYVDEQGARKVLKIESGVAFLVDKTRHAAHGIALPRYRQQLVFVDVANHDNPQAQRTPSIHIEAPSKGETLLLLLRVSDGRELPVESSKFHVELSIAPQGETP